MEQTEQKTQTPPVSPDRDPIKEGLLLRMLGHVAPEQVTPVIPPDDKKPDPLKPDDKVVVTDPPKPDDKTVTPDPLKPDDKVVVTDPPKPGRVVKLVKRTEEKPLTKADLDEALKKQEPVKAPEPAPVDELEGLLDEERREVELARYGEGKDEKFKGLSTKLAKFYKDNKAKLETLAADDPEFNPDQNQEYKDWLKANRPRFSRSERDTLFASKIKDEAIAEATQKHQAEIETLRRQIKGVEVSPAIEKRASAVESEILDGYPGPVKEFLKANGNDLSKAEQEFPLEVKTYAAAARGAKQVASEYFAVREGVRPFDPKTNRTHAYIAQFILTQADQFAKTGGDALVRDGKTFVTPDNYDPAKAGTTWTFTDDDIVSRLKSEALSVAAQEIAAKEKEAAALGFARAKKTAPVATPTPVIETPPPKSTPSRPTGPVTTPPAEGENVLHKLLGIKPPQ